MNFNKFLEILQDQKHRHERAGEIEVELQRKNSDTKAKPDFKSNRKKGNGEK